MDTSVTKPDSSKFRGDILFELFGTYLSTLNSATKLRNYLGGLFGAAGTLSQCPTHLILEKNSALYQTVTVLI